MERVNIAVNERLTSGKSSNKSLRIDGLVPAIVYHKNEDAISIQLNHKELHKTLSGDAGRNVLIDLNIKKVKGESTKTVVVKAIQHHPMSGKMIHVDFHQISLKEKICVTVPLVLKGEAEGVKNEGGVLELHAREIEVECMPTNMPEHVDVDISTLKLNESVHVRDLVLPNDVTAVSDEDTVVVQVVAPHVEEEQEVEEQGAAEPEVIGGKQEDGEDAAVNSNKKA